MKRFVLPKIRFFRMKTIGAKLFLAVMGGAFVGLGSAAFLYYQVLEQQSEVQIRGTLSTEVNGIESQLTPVKQSLINLGGMVQHLKETGVQDPNAYQGIALDFFLKRPSLVMGQSLQQTAYGVFADRKWYASYHYADQKVPGQIGKRLPSPNASVLFSDLVKEDNAPNKAYFRDTIAASHDTWLEPYDWYNISMTTANHLLLDRQGRLQGFVAMDVNATQLSSTIHPTVFRDTGYFVVMTQRGTLVSYPPDMAKVRQSYRSIPTLATIWPLLQNDAAGIFQSNGKYWAYQRIPSTQWIMLAVVPEAVVFWPVLTTTLGGAGIAAIVLVLVVIGFVQYLDRRLKPILDECYRLEAEDARRSIRLGQTALEERNTVRQNRTFKFRNVDELEILQKVFWRVAAQLKASFDDLELRVAERTAQLDEAKQSAENAKDVAIVANRSKSQFLANMSHELRTPLNAILGFAQIMSRDSSLKKEQQENLSIIGRSGEHLLALINDVLDMSKIESGQIGINADDFDLHYLLDSVKEMLEQRAKTKGLQLVFTCADELPQYIGTDKKKLSQVLLNLLGNAVKFTKSGFVSLQVDLDDRAESKTDLSIHLRFAIEDSGPGIAPNEMNLLFEPFVQTESGRKSEEGTGLGLSISRKFVELMGGTLQASSTFGQGTRFEFAIPVRLSAAVPPVRQQVRRVTGLVNPHPSHRILVVDDHWENRRLLVKLLEPVGFEVKEAANGQEAIACWQTWKPHLIWMDMRMPVLNGFEATQRIKAHLQGQATIVIALTASALYEEIPVIRSAGCDDFVRKPFLECEIFDKIGQYLNVQYTYRTLTVNPPEPVISLTQEALAVMPQSWLADLSQASAKLDMETIADLIGQIPEEHIALRQSIQAKVDNFDFDHIVLGVQQVRTL